METLNELKKLPLSELTEAIKLDVYNTQVARQEELVAQYRDRHPGIECVPDFILKDSYDLSLNYTIGGLQTLLKIAIQDLQTAEAETKDREYADSKSVKIPLEDWDKMMKASGIR